MQLYFAGFGWGGLIDSSYQSGDNRLMSFINDTKRAEKITEVKRLIELYLVGPEKQNILDEVCKDSNFFVFK